MDGDDILLDETETHHCLRVLRHRQGDPIAVVDGRGGYGTGIIVHADKKNAVLRIRERLSPFKPRSFRLHIAIAPMKQIDRFEWFLEKATEIGVDTIIPLICRRSERTSLRMDRLRQLLIATMKQSQQAWLPDLRPLVSFAALIGEREEQYPGSDCFFGYCAEDIQFTLNQRYSRGRDALLLIGPAGDFDEEEIALAFAGGCVPFSLGSSRLRTETAGIMSCAWIHALNA